MDIFTACINNKGMQILQSYFLSFWNIFLLSAPYLLIGLLLAGMIHIFLPNQLINKRLGSHKFSNLLYLAALGIPLPLCSCSIIPAAVALKKKGASIAETSVFLIATPETGVDSISMSLAFMDPFMAIIRPIFALISALAAGVMQKMFNFKNNQLVSIQAGGACCQREKKETDIYRPAFIRKLFMGLHYAFFDLLDDIAIWLLLGFFLSAFIQANFNSQMLAFSGTFAGKLGVLAFSIPLYICASASTPLAASLVISGFSPGAAVIFLLCGPATNITNLVVLRKFIGTRGMIINLMSVSLTALAASYLVDFYYYSWLSVTVPKWQFANLNSQEVTQSYFLLACAVILMFLMAKSLKRIVHNKFFKNKTAENCCG